MRILLLGSNGQVGFELARAVAPLGQLTHATRDGTLLGGVACERLDLGSHAAIHALLDRVQPALIVNAAAYTAVDRAEDEPELADAINHAAVAVLGAWAQANAARVLHYSTDYVFDGRASRPYREADPTDPLGVYGRSKLAGEMALRDSGCAYIILRTAWVYGARGANFLRTMLRLAATRPQLRVVADQIGAPTSSRLIAATTVLVLARWLDAPANASAAQSGTYHLSAAGACSWHAFASALVQAAVGAGVLDTVPEVVAISTADYPTRAMRPAYSVLDTSALSQRFGLSLPAWQDGLAAVIGELAAAPS